MSRSFKKNPIIKDNGGGKKFSKKLSHHRERVAVRSILQNNNMDKDKLFPAHRPHELINQYDVCDWKWSPLYSHSWAETLSLGDILTYKRK